MLSVIEIGERIAVARKLRNLSQAQLAEMLSISAQAVSKWERGESMPDIVTFGRLAEMLGVDLNYFNGGQEVPSAMSGLPLPADAADGAQARKHGWNMSRGNWADADFSGLHGLAEKMSAANIERCRFVGSELSGLILRGNNIGNSDFSQSDLTKCRFSYANLQGSTFVRCDFSGSEFVRSNVENCDFSGANLTNAVIRWGNLRKIKFSDAVLCGTAFRWGQLTEITFDGVLTDCSFENCDFARVVFEGTTIRNTFFKNSKLKRAQFRSCKADKLSYAFMKSCKADLTEVDIID